jgi:hypothetical protein
VTSPLFIIGTERSGTNLLRLILNAHSAIAVPHPPHIVKLFDPLELLYGNLAVDANFRRLIKDVCRLVELHTYPWEIMPNREAVFRDVQERNLLCIYFAVYDQFLSFTGKQRWCCKSTFMIEHVADILSYYPDARFIFMVRDGRDVAASAKSSIFNHFHVYYSALRWQREQRRGLEWLATLPPEQILLLKYEDLISDVEATVRKLCVFLGEPFEEQMLAYHLSGEARKSGALSVSWENTAKPVIKGNANKYRCQLTQKEIMQFEAIAHEEMQELSYRLDNPLELLLQKQSELTVARFSYRLSELQLKIKAEINHLIKDKNSAARLRKNLYMSYIRLLRRMSTPNA